MLCILETKIFESSVSNLSSPRALIFVLKLRLTHIRAFQFGIFVSRLKRTTTCKAFYFCGLFTVGLAVLQTFLICVANINSPETHTKYGGRHSHSCFVSGIWD